MAEETKVQETEENVVEEAVVEAQTEEQVVETQEQSGEEVQIEVDGSTAFQMKLLELDKAIGMAELEVAKLKAQKSSFIYDNNVNILAEQHKAKMIENQIKEETAKKLQAEKEQ